MKRLSTVIICHNTQHRLKQLLPGLYDALADIDSEIILIDNGSTDGTREYITRHHPTIHYNRLPRNHGVAYARNRGIETARGEYVWLLDDDTEVNATAINRMLAHMDANPHCGICACRLLDTDGKVQESFKPYPGLKIKLRNLLRHPDTSPYAAQAAAGEIFHPTYLIGACQLIRSTTIATIGLLDEKIFYGPEDADYCLRAAAAGYTIDYLPSAYILHHWQRLTTTSPLSPLGRAHIRALIHFWLRHRRLH